MAWINRLTAAYAALGKAPAPGGALERLYPDLTRREHLTAGTTTGGTEVERYVAHALVYRSYVWVRKAITVITTNVAPLRQRVVDADGVAVEGHEVTALLAKPNEAMDGAELREIRIVHKLLGGEWFLEAVPDARGRIVELWPRRPDEVWVIGNGEWEGYPIPLAYEVPTLAQPMIAADYMIHEMFMNPLNVWRGISPLGALRAEIAVDLATLQNTQRAVTDGTRSFAITADQALTPDERRRAEVQLEDKYGRHRPMLLEGGQKIQAFGTAPDDLEWLDARDYAREAVGALFGVPDEIMGFGKDTYNNFEVALKVLWTLTLKPMSDREDATLTQFFSERTRMLRPGERIETDLSSIGVLQDELAPKVEQAARLWSLGVPYNTIEAMLRLGTGPIAGGDTGYLPTSVVPAALAGMPTTATLAAPAPVRKAPNPRQIGEALRRVKLAVAAETAPKIDFAFVELAADVERRARAAWGRKDFSNLELDDILPPGEEWGLLAVLRAAIVNVCQASWALWNVSLDVEVEFEQSDPAVVRALAQAGTRITGIAETTRDAVRSLLQLGASEGWSLADLVDGRDGVPGLNQTVAQTYANRGMAIARTEVGYGQATATIGRYQAAGVTRVLIYDNGVEDSDPTCAALNGTTQTLAWYQANQLQHPNCLVGSSVVIAPNKTALFSRWFEGEVIIIRTADDNLLTCTPNHPVLTPHGWVAAGEIAQGDYVIRSVSSDRISLALDPDYHEVPAAIEDMVRTPVVPFSMPPRIMPSAPVYFHGDGGGSDVYVERTYGELRHNLYPTRSQERRKFALENAIVSAALLASSRAGLQFGDACGSPPHSIERMRGDLAPPLFTSILIEQAHRLGLGASEAEFTEPGADRGIVGADFGGDVSRGSALINVPPAQRGIVGAVGVSSGRSDEDTVITEPAVQGCFTNTEAFGDLAYRLAALVAPTQVVHIERRQFAGHVYNLETLQGWYIADGIITHNCLRVASPVLD
jgi:HK97 family phage portal protein